LLYSGAREHSEEKELVGLALALIAINGRNRLAISFQTVSGSYRDTGECYKQLGGGIDG
jgi:hypothetical protein